METGRKIAVVSATLEEREVVANLVQLYLYDMTSNDPFAIGADGRYEYDFLERFWRFPYLIRVGGELAGFALVIDECPLTARRPCFFMAEFFVLKAYRRRQVGRVACEQIWRWHPGQWHVAYQPHNQDAARFWQGICPVSDTRALKFDGADWRLHAFETGDHAAESGAPTEL